MSRQEGAIGCWGPNERQVSVQRELRAGEVVRLLRPSMVPIATLRAGRLCSQRGRETEAVTGKVARPSWRVAGPVF